ncbi:MAG: hypothetical protein ACRD98_00235 [Nitrososphaera sp.]
MDGEFDLITTAITSKANKVIGGTSGNIVTRTGGGDIQDAGLAATHIMRNNVVKNGKLDVWQDSRSETGITGSTARIADGFKFEASNHGTWTIDRSTDVPTQAQAGGHLNYSIRALCTTADGTVAAADFALLNYYVEGYEYAEVYQQAQTISFWVKSNLVGTFGAALRNSTSDRSYVMTFSISVADTWELKTVSLTAAPVGGTWDLTNGAGIILSITLAAGTNFQTTADAWQTGNFVATSAQANLAGTVNNYLRLADVRLHGGVTRVPVIILSFQQTLSWARRRFSKTFNYDATPAQNIGTFAGAHAVYAADAGFKGLATWDYGTVMRALPTITTYNPHAATANWRNFANTLNGTIAVGTVGNRSVTIHLDPGSANEFYGIHVEADARF